MATDGGDQKWHKYEKIRSRTGSGHFMKDMVGSMTDGSRKFSRTLEHGDGQGIKVRSAKKLSPDRKKVVTQMQMFHRDIEKVRKEVDCRALTCREPLGNIFQLQTPAWYCTLVEGRSSAALHILVHRERVQWENQILSLNVCAADNHKERTSSSGCSHRELSSLAALYQGFPVFVHVPGCENREVLCSVLSQNQTLDNRNKTWNQAPKSCRLSLHIAQSTVLMAMSSYGDILKPYLGYSDLPLRLSNTYGAQTWSSQGLVYEVCSHEMTSVEKNRILNPSGSVCCLQFTQQIREESTDNSGSDQLHTKIDDTTNVSNVKENPYYLRHEEDEHLSSDYYFATSDQTDQQKSVVHMICGDKLKRDCSLEENSQLKAAPRTLNPTHDAWITISCSSNAISRTGSSDLCVQNINANGYQNDYKCNNEDNISIRHNEHIKSCQNITNKRNGSREEFSVGRDKNSNKNNSNEHHVDSDGSSDSEMDCTYEENNDNCKIGRGPEASNAAPPTGYQTNAENLEDKHRDCLNEYFNQITMDSSANSTYLEMEHDTETSTDIVCESLTLSNGGKTCERAIYNSKSAMGVPQPAEKLGDGNCQNDQEFHMHNPNDELLFIGQACVETRTEQDAHNNTESEHCSSVNIGTDAEIRHVSNCTNEAVQMKEDKSQIQDNYSCPAAKRYSNTQEKIDDSATRSEQCLSQVFGNDFNMMTATGIETFPPSQEDFTENNGTLQASFLDKAIGLEGMTSTEITEPVGMLGGLYEESEILKCWEGSIHIRQTGQCSLEDIKSVHFLNMLTNRLIEYTNNDAFISSPESPATSTYVTGQSQSDYSISEKELVSSAPFASDHECLSVCENTGSEIYASATQAVTYEQQRGHPDAMTTEKPKEAGIESVLFEHPKNGSERKTDLSSEHTGPPHAVEENVLMTPTQDPIAEPAEDAPQETLSNCQKAEANDLCELWSTKYTISLSDEFLQKYDLLTMQSKEKYKKCLDSLKTGTTDLKRNINYEFADPAFEVDVFRSLEYATSLSCGLASEKRSFGPVVYEQSNFRGEFHDLAATMPKENSRNNGGSACERETVFIKSPESEKTYSVSMPNENTLCQINDEEATSYSKDRMMRASERRRKLMTEFEEITSCADVYSWPKYNRHFCYESGNFCQDYDSPLKRQANHLETTVQSEGKHRVGTFTIEYLKPPVTGFVVLK